MYFSSRESSFDIIYSIFVLMNASVQALDDDEGMSEVCSKYTYVKKPMLWQEGKHQGCILQDSLKQSHMIYRTMM